MIQKIASRNIHPQTEKELWARAAGRCQFDGCNQILYSSPITLEEVNIAEKAHIYSFSINGPRGRGELSRDRINSAENLLLVCSTCHTTIDNKDGKKYPADLLKKWKQEHEQRIGIVTSIPPDKKSHTVFYSGRIGDLRVPIQKMEAFSAMFPERYPVTENPINLSMQCSLEDNEPEFWQVESDHLRRIFNKLILPLLEDNNPIHFSLFAFAPMPLLIKLGTLFTDKIPVEVYQPKREPKTWKWQAFPDNFQFVVNEPDNFDKPPVLIISLSASIAPNRVTTLLGDDVTIWELTVNEPFLHNDLIQSPAQLAMFRSEVRKLMIQIKQKHGNNTTLHIFPAMPISCAIELGRIRMPKADMPWVIYDQNNRAGKFIEAITM
ncbi:SAVED domain-containing protein [Legionella pneumophila]